MTDPTTILAPIRFPLTEQSENTLATAGRLTRENAPARLTALHVNLYQKGTPSQKEEIARAVSSTLDGIEATVTIRQGYLVEEVILDEATQIGADIVVVGENQQVTWRKLLARVLRASPDVSVFLRENVTDATEVMEVGTATESPKPEVV